MKIRGLFNWCVVLLWLAVTHHCIFEQLVSEAKAEHSLPPLTSASTELPLSDSCPAHSKTDPASHGEGEFCGNVTHTITISSVQLVSKACMPIFLVVANWLNQEESCSEYKTQALADEVHLRNLAITRLSHSLTLAPNAPPSARLS